MNGACQVCDSASKDGAPDMGKSVSLLVSQCLPNVLNQDSTLRMKSYFSLCQRNKIHNLEYLTLLRGIDIIYFMLKPGEISHFVAI